MNMTFRPSKIDDANALRALVREHAESLEPGLEILDEGVAFGEGAVDLVARDAVGHVVLIAVAFAADDPMLVRILEAFDWCLDYPEVVGRLYAPHAPALAVPPRVMFVSQRLSDGFLRRLKHLGMPSIVCLELRHVEVNGAAGLYFNPVESPRPSPVPRQAEPPVEAVRTVAADVDAVAAPSAPEAPLLPEGLPAELLNGLRMGERLSALWRRILTRAIAAPDPAKIRIIQEYLKTEFVGCLVSDFYERQRAAQQFQVRDDQGRLMHTAAVSDSFFEAVAEDDIVRFLERHRLGHALRGAGADAVLVGSTGLQAPSH